MYNYIISVTFQIMSCHVCRRRWQIKKMVCSWLSVQCFRRWIFVSIKNPTEAQKDPTPQELLWCHKQNCAPQHKVESEPQCSFDRLCNRSAVRSAVLSQDSQAAFAQGDFNAARVPIKTALLPVSFISNAFGKLLVFY